MMRPRDSIELNVRRLAVFRVLFGALMAGHVIHLWLSGALRYYFIDPAFHLKYPGLHGLPLPDETVVFLSFGMVFLCSIMLALGVFARWASMGIALIYGYFLLADVSFFKHHHYLFLLVSVLLSVIRTDHKWALLRSSVLPDEGRLWLGLTVLRIQMVLPYFFGGLSKAMNPDWVTGETAEMILLATFPQHGFIQSFAPFLTWGGLLFDLTIGFFLFLPMSRPLAFGAVILFNLTNALVFSIDVFPWMMISSAVLFWGKAEHRASLPLLSQNRSELTSISVATLYLIFQLVLPLRHLMIPGDVFWTGEGYMAGWHMIDSLKRNRITFTITDAENGLNYQIPAEEHFTARQRGTLARFPEFLPQAARYIASKATLWNISDPQVTAVIEVSKNGRPFLPLVYPDAELLNSKSKVLRHDAWIIPSEEEAVGVQGSK